MDSEIITDQFSDGDEEDFELESDSDNSDDEQTEFEYNWELNANHNSTAPVNCELQQEWKNENVSKDSTPLKIMREFITDKMLSDICAETNNFVESVPKSRTSFSTWKPLEIPELWNFLGLNFLMGLIRKSTIKDYWTTNPLLATPQFNKKMARTRFEEILRGLHFCNNSKYDFKTDRFLKLGEFMTQLQSNFMDFITPGEYMCLDESLLKFLGRLKIKQCIRTKRARFGIKIFLLADCATNFIVKFLPYQGKITKLTASVTEWGSGGATVITMMRDFFKMSRKVVVDNYFNSPKLASFLLTVKTFILDNHVYVKLGTVRKTRKNMPKMNKKQKKGDVDVYTSGNLMVERWLDRREVLILNTFVPHSMQPSTSTNPNSTKEKPQSVHTYNNNMGAVDLSDQITKPFVTERRTLKWYKKYFFHLLDMTVYNSLQYYNSQREKNEQTCFKLFLLDLISEIFDEFPIERPTTGRPVTVVDDSYSFRVCEPGHLPQKLVNDKNKIISRKCFLCSKKGLKHEGSFRCTKCEKYFCIQTNRNCFVEYHTLKKIPTKSKTISENNDRLHYI